VYGGKSIRLKLKVLENIIYNIDNIDGYYNYLLWLVIKLIYNGKN